MEEESGTSLQDDIKKFKVMVNRLDSDPDPNPNPDHFERLALLKPLCIVMAWRRKQPCSLPGYPNHNPNPNLNPNPISKPYALSLS